MIIDYYGYEVSIWAVLPLLLIVIALAIILYKSFLMERSKANE